MSAAPAWQTVLFALAAGIAMIVQWLIAPGFVLQLLLLGTLVAMLGLPHGALDLPIAGHLGWIRDWRSGLVFGGVYLGLAASVLLVWMLLPGAALVAFLAYSALHFSSDWSAAPVPLRWTGGAATIGAPALIHHDTVGSLFARLAPPASADLAADITALAGGVALLAFMSALILKRGTPGRAALEQAVLWASALILSPLIYFAVYFCGLHSVRHFHSSIRAVPRARRALLIAMLVSGLTALTAIIWMLAQSGGLSTRLPDEGFRAIFIGLAALTVPHMLLTGYWHNQRAAHQRCNEQIHRDGLFQVSGSQKTRQ